MLIRLDRIKLELPYVGQEGLEALLFKKERREGEEEGKGEGRRRASQVGTRCRSLKWKGMNKGARVDNSLKRAQIWLKE